MAFEDCLDLESRPEHVAAARAFVRSRLTAWEVTDHVDAAVVVASELVTNAVLHARTSIQLRIAWVPPGLRIEVYDENPRLPALAPPMPEATSGRGLALVTTLATSWGIDNRDDGKVVWAELGGNQPDSDEECVDLGDLETVAEALERVRESRPDPTP